MGGEWIECTLADACSSIDYGLTASASDCEDGPWFLRITDIVAGYIDWNAVPHVAADAETAEKYRLHHGDIVLARTGASTGASAYVKNPPAAVFASYLVRIKAKPEFEPRFLAYYLKSDDFWAFIRGVLGDKSAQPNASASTMTKAPLRAPRDKNEQRAIAHILGTLDDKIELNRRMSETLEAMARALFKAWFVDFEPVRAKVEGRHPSLSGTGGFVTRPYTDLFPDRLVDSELGEIPEGWEVVNFLEVAEILSGGTPSTSISEYWNGDIPWVSAKDVSAVNGSFLLSTEKTITPLGVENSSTKILPAYTTIVTARGTVGSYCLLGKDMAMNQTNYGLRGKNGIGRFFVFFSTAEMVEHLRRQAYGTIFDTITTKTFQSTMTVRPSEPVLARFEKFVEPLMEQILNNVQMSRALAALRDALLPKLIRGEIRVKDAERFLKERGL